jgi:hypothetical protein
MKRDSTPDHRRIIPAGLFAIMLVCCLPMTGYSQELPAKDSATKPVLESLAGTNAEPVTPSTVEHPAPARKSRPPRHFQRQHNPSRNDLRRPHRNQADNRP